MVLGPSTGSHSFGEDHDAALMPTGLPETSFSRSFGFAVAWVGDTNGDSFDDLLVGDPNVWKNTGQAWLVHGPITGEPEIGDVGFAFEGIDGMDYAGYEGDYIGLTVAGGGDVDGDGLSDILLHSWGKERAYLLNGPATNVASIDAADAIFTGLGFGYLGTEGSLVSNRGDVNGDGYDDIVALDAYARDPKAPVGAAGVCYVVHGPVTGEHALSRVEDLLVNTDPDGRLFFPIRVSDVDGDGAADILAVTGSANSQARLFYGPIEGKDADWEDSLVIEDTTGDWGWPGNLALGGDSDGNGQQDILIGYPDYTGGGSIGRGAAALFFGVNGNP